MPTPRILPACLAVALSLLANSCALRDPHDAAAPTTSSTAVASSSTPPSAPALTTSTPTPKPTATPTATPSPTHAPATTIAPTKAVGHGVPLRPIDCTQVHCLALTFDDGPSEHTSRLLKALRGRDVRVTFFFLGAWAKLHPHVVRQAAADHHVLGTHSWNHPSFAKIPDSAIIDQLHRSSDILKELSGQPIDLVRPPYGEMRTPFLKTGKAVILWNTDTKDYLHWKTPRPDLTVAAALKQAKPGAILLLHDSHGPSVDAVGPIVDQLKARGYVFVTVPELLGGKLEADAIYRHG